MKILSRYTSINIQPCLGITPEFVRIKNKKSKRISPYLESEIWEKDELLSILKYEPYKRNKAALTLFWDLNGRNHEITILK